MKSLKDLNAGSSNSIFKPVFEWIKKDIVFKKLNFKPKRIFHLAKIQKNENKKVKKIKIKVPILKKNRKILNFK